MKVQIIVSDPETATFFDWSFGTEGKPTFRSFGFANAKDLTDVIETSGKGIAVQMTELKKAILKTESAEESLK